MLRYLSIIEKCSLFKDFTQKEIIDSLNCLQAKIIDLKKDSLIIEENKPFTKIGIVLQGQLQSIKLDFEGNQNIIMNFLPSQMFGEVLACSFVTSHNISLIASIDSEILLLDYQKIMHICNKTCLFHMRLIENMLLILAQKNIDLNRKLEYISKRSTKEKLMTYLFDQARLVNSQKFSIPFTRQELADYLFVERSAMSTELSKLKELGIIKYQKNFFEIL